MATYTSITDLDTKNATLKDQMRKLDFCSMGDITIGEEPLKQFAIEGRVKDVKAWPDGNQSIKLAVGKETLDKTNDLDMAMRKAYDAQRLPGE